MNQAILFNDDFIFCEKNDAWSFTALITGQLITIYVHSAQLKQLDQIGSCTRFDLEETVELWLEKNEPEGSIIKIDLK